LADVQHDPFTDDDYTGTYEERLPGETGAAYQQRVTTTVIKLMIARGFSLKETSSRTGRPETTIRDIPGVPELLRIRGAYKEALVLALGAKGVLPGDIVVLLKEEVRIRVSETTIRNILRRGDVSEKHTEWLQPIGEFRLPPPDQWDWNLIDSFF